MYILPTGHAIFLKPYQYFMEIFDLGNAIGKFMHVKFSAKQKKQELQA